MKQIDYAYSRTKPITRKTVILSTLDAFISGMMLVLFLGIALGIMWLIFGH